MNIKNIKIKIRYVYPKRGYYFQRLNVLAVFWDIAASKKTFKRYMLFLSQENQIYLTQILFVFLSLDTY